MILYTLSIFAYFSGWKNDYDIDEIISYVKFIKVYKYAQLHGSSR